MKQDYYYTTYLFFSYTKGQLEVTLRLTYKSKRTFLTAKLFQEQKLMINPVPIHPG